MDQVETEKKETRKTYPHEDFGKGQTGSALVGSLQILVLFDRGTFWVLPLTYF